MLQFITKGSAGYSAEDEARMAIDGGCRWIQLSTQALHDNEVSVRKTAERIIPLCQEADCFMVIEDNVELVDELRVHGVYLHDAGRTHVANARERLGANAVLGVQPTSHAQLMELRGLDVDYVAVTPEVAAACPGASPDSDMASNYKTLIDTMRLRGLDFHVVVLGDVPPASFKDLLKAGCAGVAVSSSIADAPDPMAATAHLISALDEARTAAYEEDADNASAE